MTWYEPTRGKHRAKRYKLDGSGKSEVGPLMATEGLARRWAIQQGWEEGFSHRLVDVVAEWVRVRSRSDESVDPRFLRATEHRLANVFARMGWVDVREISIFEFDRFRTNDFGLGFTRNANYLLSILRWARRHLKITVDPDIIDWQFPRKRRTLIARAKLTTDQVLDALEAMMGWGVHAHGLGHYLSTYGARPATACILRIRQVNFREGMLDLRAKTSGEWKHKLQDRTLEIFSQLAWKRGLEEPLFLCPFHGTGRFVHRVARQPWKVTDEGEANQMTRWYKSKIGKGLSFPAELTQIYHLKRYAITTALRRGLTPKEVALFTGHLSIDQVLKYSETNEHESADVVDRLGPQGENSRDWTALPQVERLGPGATATVTMVDSMRTKVRTHTHTEKSK